MLVNKWKTLILKSVSWLIRLNLKFMSVIFSALQIVERFHGKVFVFVQLPNHVASTLRYNCGQISLKLLMAIDEENEQ